jgi:hypothetical protein
MKEKCEKDSERLKKMFENCGGLIKRNKSISTE